MTDETMNQAQADDQAEAKTHNAKDLLEAIVADTTEALDNAVNAAGDLIGTTRGSRIAGGAMIGAAASLLLPVSLLGGALIGAGYAAVRTKNR